MATSIFLRFSACVSLVAVDPRLTLSPGACQESLPSLVVPSTSLATSEPNLAAISEMGTPQFSGTSWSRAATREPVSS